MSRSPDRTVYAQQAYQLADVFAFKFGAVRFGHRRPRRLELSTPDGPSTAGGRVARQNLLLAAPETGGPSPIVVGWVDLTSQQAELRSFRRLAQQFEARHGRAIDLESEAYAQLEAELTSFFRTQNVELARVDVPPSGSPRRSSTSPESTGSGMLLIGVVVGLGFGYLIFGG